MSMNPKEKRSTIGSLTIEHCSLIIASKVFFDE